VLGLPSWPVAGAGVGLFGGARNRYQTIVEQHPDWSEEQCIQHWNGLVAKSNDKITEGGEVFIAKAKVLILDDVEATMQVKRVGSHRAVGSSDDLAVAVEAADSAQSKFRRIQATCRPHRSRVPGAAMQVDIIEGNNTDTVNTALGKTTMESTLKQELTQAAIDQAAKDRRWSLVGSFLVNFRVYCLAAPQLSCWVSLLWGSRDLVSGSSLRLSGVAHQCVLFSSSALMSTHVFRISWQWVWRFETRSEKRSNAFSIRLEVSGVIASSDTVVQPSSHCSAGLPPVTPMILSTGFLARCFQPF
jgi:hypothetical protein